MCLICDYLEKEFMSPWEAREALTELLVSRKHDPEHYQDIMDKIKEKEGNSE